MNVFQADLMLANTQLLGPQPPSLLKKVRALY